MPLKDVAGPPDPRSSPLAFENEEVAFAKPTGEVGWDQDGTRNAFLVELSGLRGGGTYTGAVQLSEGEAAKVTLTVRATDPWWGIVMAVVVCVLLEI